MEVFSLQNLLSHFLYIKHNDNSSNDIIIIKKLILSMGFHYDHLQVHHFFTSRLCCIVWNQYIHLQIWICFLFISFIFLSFTVIRVKTCFKMPSRPNRKVYFCSWTRCFVGDVMMLQTANWMISYLLMA